MIVLDAETTGVSLADNACIVSIGAIDYYQPGNSFYRECRIPDWAAIDHQALSINGFTEEEIRDPSKPTLAAILQEFVDWRKLIPSKIIGGTNVFFDNDFLQENCSRSGVKIERAKRICDLHSLIIANFIKRGQLPPLRPNGLSDVDTDFIMPFVGLPKEPRPHNALTGAKMEAEAFSRLIQGRNLLPEFASYPIPDYLSK